MFDCPEDAMKSIVQDGFNWSFVREYFRFTDQWLREGQYRELLELALASIESDKGRHILLDMLDLQYAVFLEQVALQEQMLGRAACDEKSVAFGERVMSYLQLNLNLRPNSNSLQREVRSALFRIPPGTLISRLLGQPAVPATADHSGQKQNKGQV